MNHIESLLHQIDDLRRQVYALQRLEHGSGGTASLPDDLAYFSGTPVAGRLAQWTGAGTIEHTAYPGSAVTRYSGVPTAGAVTYWTGNGTVAHASFGTADVITQTLGDARYGRLAADNTWTGSQDIDEANGTYSAATGANVDNIRLTRDAATPGSAAYGGGIGFDRVGQTGRTHAAIVAKQTTSDTDQLGLAFFTHPSASTSDAMEEAMVLDHAGEMSVKNIIKAMSSSGLTLEDDGGNLGIFVEDGGQVGVAVATPLGNLHGYATAFTDTVLVERGGQTTDSTFSSMRLLATKTTNMGDGFGPMFAFVIQDDGAVLNSIGAIGAVRAGGDTTGDLIFQPVLAGAFAEKVRITSTGQLLLITGASANYAAAGGVLNVNTTATGNTGAGDDILTTYTVPADTLAVNGQSLWLEASGVNTAAVTVRVKFGGTTFATHTVGAAAGYWTLRARVIRTGAATQKVYCSINDGLNNGFAQVGTLAATLSNSNAIAVSGESGAGTSNQITIQTFIAGFDDNNT